MSLPLLVSNTHVLLFLLSSYSFLALIYLFLFILEHALKIEVGFKTFLFSLLLIFGNKTRFFFFFLLHIVYGTQSDYVIQLHLFTLLV